MKTSIGALTLALSIVALPSHDPCAATIAPQMSCPSCEDFDSCTIDSCDMTTGTCRHDPLDCDDGNPCTADTCDSHGSIYPTNGCRHGWLPSGTACDDGAACTAGDACDGSGHCIGQPQPSGASCDDGNPCTTGDTCDVSGTCSGAAVPAGAECDDRNACTRGERCAVAADGSIACQGPAPNCDDGNLCTTDACDPITGDCVHTPLNCDDGNPCTDEACDPATGVCTRTIRTGSCDDKNICTVNEACVDGNCVSGGAFNCNWGPECGSSTCFPYLQVCDTFPSTTGCGTPPPCQAYQCTFGHCQFTLGGAAGPCTDNNPCTRETCHQRVCAVFEVLNGAACDDQSLCTFNDVCANSQCVGTSVCSDGDICTDDACDPATGTCLGHTAKNCDDGNPCTTDSCNPATGCVHTLNNNPCDDHNACTANDQCSNGQCLGTLAVICPSDGNICTNENCDPRTGACVHTNNLVSCNADDNPCTVDDRCQDGSCHPGLPLNCNDSNVCTADSCDPATGACTHLPVNGPCADNNACTTNDTCVAGACQPGPPLNCDDGNDCTMDGCRSSTGCYHAALTGPCDDKNPCTTGDACVNGVCTPSAPVSCIDHNACTIDSCDRTTGACIHQTSSGDCDDGDACTVDECDPTNGTCLGHHPLDCDDANDCTVDTCDPSSGCRHEFTCPQEVLDITLTFGSPLGKGSGTLSWRTNGEVSLSGFNVVVLNSQGVPTRINPVTIPCTECVTTLGAPYFYVLPKHKSGHDVFVQIVGAHGSILGTFGPAQKAP